MGTARKLVTMAGELGELRLAEGVDARTVHHLLRTGEAHFAAREAPATGYRLHAGGRELGGVVLAADVDVRQLVTAQRLQQLWLAAPDAAPPEPDPAPARAAPAVRRRGG
jgi:hypothetical protein